MSAAGKEEAQNEVFRITKHHLLVLKGRVRVTSWKTPLSLLCLLGAGILTGKLRSSDMHYTYMKQTMAYLSSYIRLKTEGMAGGVDSTAQPLQCHGMPTTE